MAVFCDGHIDYRQGGRPCYNVWIVKLALDRPYTFIILALLILILSPVVILRTPVDIFPNINIPVVAIAWQYGALFVHDGNGPAGNFAWIRVRRRS
jgi:hypothetical protein